MKRNATPPEPPWPKERNLARYNALVGFKIQNYLRDGGLWIDVGVGQDARPMRPLIGRPGVTLKAISPHFRKLPAAISLTTGTIPEHTGFLAENRGRAQLVTDVFGAVSYCDDPLQALIYGALLLRPGGTLVAFTELRRVGDLDTWDRITEFFNSRMQQTITFETVFAWGDSSKHFSTYLRISIQGAPRRTLSFPRLLQASRRMLGKPRRGKLLWVASDRSAKIWRANYG
jgi:hypothetical protein